MRLERSMALEESRLTRNLANLKNRETAKNKFLKTKAKIQEFKQNTEEARDEAAAIHDYVKQGEVQMANSIPPLEANSFQPLIDALQQMFGTDSLGNFNTTTPIERAQIINGLSDSLDICLATTTSGQQYLTTRARALQLGANITPITSQLASQLSAGSGTIK